METVFSNDKPVSKKAGGGDFCLAVANG